jgi:hypothetical protein
MKGVVQSRTGEQGTCFRACTATILGLPEAQVPDWPQANLDPGVNPFFAKYGVEYTEVPAVGNVAPIGLHYMLGTSPRGGQHAVVGYDGSMVWDPHPQDGTGRGLVDVARWGLLQPLAGAVKALDCLSIEYCPQCGADAEHCYCPNKAKLLSGHTLGEDEFAMREILDALGITIAEYMRRSEAQKEALLQTAVEKLKREHGKAQDAVTLHPDKDGDYALCYTAKDAAPPYKAGDTIKLPSGKRAIVTKITLAKNLFGEPEWHVATKSGEVVTVRASAAMCVECGQKPTKRGEHFCSDKCETAWITKHYPEDAKRGFTLDAAVMRCALDYKQRVTSTANASTLPPGESTYYKRYRILALRNGRYAIDRDGAVIMHEVKTLAEAKKIIDDLA